MTEAMQVQMQQMMKKFGGGMPQIPGLKPGADPYQAVQQLRQMGLLPDDPNAAKKANKIARGRK